MANETFDFIIIGAGPAGLSAATYAARGGLKTVVLENASEGGQVVQIADLENYPGVFPAVNGYDFISTMKDQAEHFGAVIKHVQVSSIDKKGNDFVVKTKDTDFTAPTLLIATGAFHRNLEVPGEKEFTGRGVSYCAVCDGPFFKNKKIFVVGGGDSACSEAIYLSTVSKDVTIIHRRDSFRAQKSVVDKMLSVGVKPIYDSVVKEIKGSAKVESIIIENVITKETTELAADAVFIFAGMLPQTALVEMLPKDVAGYIITDEKMETSIPGLYAAGDVRSKSFRQVVTAVSDGAIAANSAKERILK
ncbi:MAG: thioredoxin-disulfide reductase [Treponema sp.]|nr:thioredoxin-disulfide reductase [Treponema sp.]